MICGAKGRLPSPNLAEISGCFLLTRGAPRTKRSVVAAFRDIRGSFCSVFRGRGDADGFLIVLSTRGLVRTLVLFSSHLRLLLHPYFPPFRLLSLRWSPLPRRQYTYSSDTMSGPSRQTFFPLTSTTFLSLICPCFG